MAIYDNDGTIDYELGKVYDNDGTANYQIGKVYDNDGTVNSLIYSADITIFNAGVWDSSITPKYEGYYEGKAYQSGNNVVLYIYWAWYSGGEVLFSFDTTGYSTFKVTLTADNSKPPITVKVGSVKKSVNTTGTTVSLDISALNGVQSCSIKYANGEYNNGQDKCYISKIYAS